MPGCFNRLYYNAFYVAQHLFLKKVFQMFADVKKTVYLCTRFRKGRAVNE